MDKVNNYLTNLLTKDIELTEEQRDVISYGLEAFLYTMISTTVLFLYGMIWGQAKATIVLIGVFYTNQTIGGGFHAKTHVQCILTMLIGLSFALIILQIHSIPPIAFWGIGSLGCTLLFAFPLVLHRNKCHLESKRSYLSKKSLFISLSETMVVVITAFFDITLSNPAFLGLFLSGISRLTGYIISQRYNGILSN